MATIWWIRRDLRLEDNLTLQEALREPPILPVFNLDPLLLKTAPDRRQGFLYQNLRLLRDDLRSRGSDLIIRKGKPVDILQQVMAESGANRIIAEEDFTPYARLRSVLVGSCLPLKLVQGQLGAHPLSVLKSNGKPYQIYTPFKKRWLSQLRQIPLVPAPERIPTIPGIQSDELPLGDEMPRFHPGERAARDRLEQFLADPVHNYHLDRDRLDRNGTSYLSPYFHFGVLGLRTGIHFALTQMKSDQADQGVQAWLGELIWREFFVHVLFHFPALRTQNFRSQFDYLEWRNDRKEYQAWTSGQTGYPIVDAGMRQLRETGWMHNRVRMIAASFLVKHLLIDWRWGERWFRDHLLDADLAANNGNWQWIAGTGADAAPYFRIFNPVVQSKKFDPDGSYIRRWVPEIAHLDNSAIHVPWELDPLPGDYPRPVVLQQEARERALFAFRAARELRDKGL